MKRWLKITLLSLLALVVALPLVLLGLLNNQAASRWVLSLVPGLTVEEFQGALLDDWQAQQLIWQQGELKVEITQLKFDWQASCLWQQQVCIDQLSAAQINLNLPENNEPSEPSTEPIVLPEISLPIEIFLKQLAVADFRLNNESLLQQIKADLAWTEKGYEIHSLSLAFNEITASASGVVNPIQEWPATLNLQATVPVPDQAPINLQLATQGTLNKLQVTAQTTGYVQAQLNAQLQPLTPDLPLAATLQLQNFLAQADLPESLLIRQLGISANGDLAKGFAVQGTGQFKGQSVPVNLQLVAHAGLENAKLNKLILAQDATHKLELTGEVGWKDVLSAQAELNWQAFNWLELWPMDEPPVRVEQFNAKVKLHEQSYNGDFSGKLAGPAGDYSLSSLFSGTFEQAKLTDLTINAGKGKLAGAVEVGFADSINWLADISVDKLDPAFWVEELPGALNGHIKSQGAMHGEQLDLTADIALKGTLGRSATALTVKANGKNQDFTLEQLAFSLGDNQINATASLLSEQIKANAKLEFRRLAQFWPGLNGRLDGTLLASGTLDKPSANANLQVKRLTYQDQQVDLISLIASLDNTQKLNAKLDAQGIAVGENFLGRLQTQLSGTLDKHQLNTQLDGPELKLALMLNGQMDAKQNWQGKLNQLNIDASGQHWKLANTLQIDYLATGALTLSPHCLVSGDASFCAKKQSILPEPDIDYTLSKFTLASLQPFLPKDFKLQGQVNGQVKLKLPAAGPQGTIYLDASNGQLDLLVDDKLNHFKWSTLRLESNLTPKKITAGLNFKGPQQSQLKLDATINPLAAHKPIAGSFSIDNIDLALFKPFIDIVDRLDGNFQGKGSISGTLDSPLINGDLHLKSVYVLGGGLPVSFEPLNLTAKLQGNSMNLAGTWRSGKKGQGAIDGRIAWQNDLSLAIAIKSDQLPVVVEPYADLQIATDLKIGMEHEQLKVTGKVQVPKGTIDVPQLPTSAIQVSSDAQILGVEKPESDFKLAMDVLVEVGKEKLTFTGFGLKANILGHMQITDNMGGRGTLELKDGRYNAFGQKLELRQAQLIFAGPLSEPFLNIEAVRVTGDVTAGLRLTGSALQPQSEIFSKPAMSQEQALSWLLMGRPLEGGGDGNAMAQAAVALGLMGTSPLANKLADKVGVREFTLDTEGDGNDTSVVASGRITDKMTLRYGVGVFDPGTIMSVRYELTKRLYVEAASGMANSIDFFYKRNF